ncbi:MAG: class I SAM-dependent methyltransferase [Gammaproteobacteria bacterium]|nr:class I SAM-dependent methyltransferase [Gammaproteobacteria bacterium]MBU1646289.1 class I SAM-dependent methyltransferase [Gammaproteobacteria bacterium]MBU1970832.1 class I SAM-dependent methyltransferase [Gammaproteobacteria bacterium]
MSDAVNFFDRQFRDQIAAGEFILNPFEEAALPHLRGEVLDLGCGLGNLVLAAARAGCRVTAFDGSAAAIERLSAAAEAEGLAVVGRQADLGHDPIVGSYDSVVAIGLLMFFPRPLSTELLDGIQRATRPGGVVAANVLIEGTSYLDLFGGGTYTLFGRDELAQAFAGWEFLQSSHESFDAPGGTKKNFATVIARKPA